jgi:PadR family transcriptional regulator, regulatory protein PadR
MPSTGSPRRQNSRGADWVKAKDPCFTDASVTGSHKMLRGQGTDDAGELLPGTLGMLVLKALARGPRHGYAIAEWIQDTSGDVLRVEEGALYPALHRLELRGLLSAEWGMSDNNRRAKYYGLTAAGRKQLAAEAAQWRRLSGAIAQVMLAT